MSKSIKRNNKYFGEECQTFADYEERMTHLKEKRLRAALTSKNWGILQRIAEEE